MNALLNLSSAFGLSSAAGLNAYIPLMTLAIMANRKMIHLPAPYDAIGTWWAITILAVFLIVEIVVDKVPGADHINDVIQTAVRPTAGALLFAAQMSPAAAGGTGGLLQNVHPGVWMALGLLLGGGVHAAKSLARPVVNVTTAGLGAPIVSLVEDLVSVTLSLVAVLAPILCGLLLVIFGVLLFKGFRKFFRRTSRAIPVRAVAVVETVEASETGRATGGVAKKSWGGGV